MTNNVKRRKLKKFNFNTIVIIFLLVQILLISLGVMIIDGLNIVDNDILQYCLLAFNFIYHILDIIIILYLLYKEDSEFTIPWLILLTVFPLFGLVMFLIFKQKGLTKKQKRFVEEIYSRIAPHFKKDTFSKRDSLYLAPLTFLETVTGLDSHADNKVTYFKNGETFFPDFIEKLKEAKEFIFMEFFIIHFGKEWNQIEDILIQKAKEGVDVKLLYDDFGCFKTLPAGYFKQLRKFGIDCQAFNKVHFLLRGRVNNRSHRKIAIIDHKYGYTGGMNMGDEYANDIVRFGYWKDTMVRMEGSAIKNLITLFLTSYDLNRGEISSYSKYLDYQYPKFESKIILYPFGTGPTSLYPIRIGEQNYINILECAREEVYISTPYLIPSAELYHSIIRTSLRGVRVHLFVPKIPDKKIPYLFAKYYLPSLLKAGVDVRLYTPGFNHMKTMLADCEVAFVGTINMDYRSLVHHYECGVTMIHGEIMKDIEADFLEMMNQSEVVPTSFRLNGFQTLLCAILRVFVPLL